MTNIYDCARDIVDLAENSQDLEKVAEVMAKQRVLLNQLPGDEILLVVVVPIGIKKTTLNERYPLLLVDDYGSEVTVQDWKSEMHHRQNGYAVKR